MMNMDTTAFVAGEKITVKVVIFSPQIFSRLANFEPKFTRSLIYVLVFLPWTSHTHPKCIFMSGKIFICEIHKD